MCVYMCVCIYVCLYMCVRVYVCVRVCGILIMHIDYHILVAYVIMLIKLTTIYKPILYKFADIIIE